MNTDDSFIVGLNRDTIQSRHRAAGAACRPGVSIYHSGAGLYLRLPADICGSKECLFSNFSRSINWHGLCTIEKYQAY
jgi:hypothetical protein